VPVVLHLVVARTVVLDTAPPQNLRQPQPCPVRSLVPHNLPQSREDLRKT
jgi:hypothetical protein